MKKNSRGILLFSVLIVAGLIIFGAVKFHFWMEKEMTKGTKAIGVVSSVTKENDRDSDGETITKTIAYITFTAADGQQYKFKSNYTTSSMHVGETHDVYYNPQDPSGTASVHIKGFAIMLLLMLLLSLFIFALPVGIIVAVVIFYKKNNVNALRSKWTPVKATVTKISAGEGKLSEYAIAEAADEYGQVYQTAYDPAENNIKENDIVSVYINPDNPSKYFIDII